MLNVFREFRTLRRGNYMRRLLIVAATAVTLAIPSATLMGLSGSAGAANSHASSVTCTKLTGTETGNVTVSGCTPASAKNTSASAKSVSLALGGYLKWASSGQTTKVSKPHLVTTGKACPSGTSEEVATGTVVAGGTSTYTKTGDAFSASVCITKAGTKKGTIAILKGTTVKL
jgi:hypothetical protein